MATQIELGVYHASSGRDVPCVVVTGYDSSGDVTVTESAIVTADLLLFGEANTRLAAVTKGTAAGEFQVATDFS